MVPRGTNKDVARIVDYQRFYKPKIEEFVKGFEYEYVQFSFKQLFVDLPDLDSDGRKPGCIYCESWRKAIWGTPWGILKISHIKELMKKDKVRAKQKLPTKYFKDLLKDQPLAFSWNGLHIVVFPKRTIKKDDVEIIDNYKVYVNGVEQSLIRTKADSKLFKKWFSSGADAIKLDWRYLLDLDVPNVGSTNALYQFFEGVYTKDEDLFTKIGENFITGGGPDNPPSSKLTGAPRGYYAALKAAKKTIEQKDNPMKVAKYKAKSEEELSDHVLEDRKLKEEQRIKRIVEQEVKDAIAEQKKAERFLADDRNRQKMEQQIIVCIQNIETKEVLKLTAHESIKYIKTDKWEYVPKYMWKTQLRKEREERKKNAEENRVEQTGVTRKMRRFKPKRQGKFIQHKKKAVEYETEIEGDQEYYVEESDIIFWPESEYEYIPVVYGKHHKKAGQPFMIFGYDEDGNKVLKQAVKRVIKKVYNSARGIQAGAKLVRVERWKRVVKNTKEQASEKEQATA